MRFPSGRLPAFLFGLVWLTLALPASALAEDEEDKDWTALAKAAHAQLTTRPADPDLLNLSGYLHFRAGVTDVAYRAYRAAIKARPRFAVAWNNLGVLLMRQKKYEEAEICFRRALEIDKRYSKARYNLAVSRFRQGAYRESLFMYLDLRDDDPEYTNVRTNPLKAEEELDAALAADPDNFFLKQVRKRVKSEAPRPVSAPAR